MIFLYRQYINALLISIFCFFGVVGLQFPRMQTMLNRNQSVSMADLEKDLQAEKIRLNLLEKMPNFGYDNILANAVFLSFLQYFGDDEVREKTGYHLSPEYFEIILKQDPRFQFAYLGLSTSTSIYAAMPERAVNITARGLKSLSPFDPEKSYYIWRYKGIDQLLFLGKSKDAKKSFQTAADWAKNYSDDESKTIAIASESTAKFLERNPNSKTALVAAWTMVLQNGVDERTRQRAIAEIEKLGGEVVNTPMGAQIRFSKQD